MRCALFYPALFLLVTQLTFAQDFDKKAFCISLKNVMSVFEASKDSLKGEYIGADSYGDKQWKAKVMLSDARLGTFYHNTSLSNEYRATYVMKEKVRNPGAAALYKQLVGTTRSCYGSEFFLQEMITTEHRGGVKAEQLEAEFTRTEFGNSTGHQFPYIRISSTAYGTGETFEVVVELISQE